MCGWWGLGLACHHCGSFGNEGYVLLRARLLLCEWVRVWKRLRIGLPLMMGGVGGWVLRLHFTDWCRSCGCLERLREGYSFLFRGYLVAGCNFSLGVEQVKERKGDTRRRYTLAFRCPLSKRKGCLRLHVGSCVFTDFLSSDPSRLQ